MSQPPSLPKKQFTFRDLVLTFRGDSLDPSWPPGAEWCTEGLTGQWLYPQLGLLVDFSPDGLMIPEDGVNDEELEAEFLALVGDQPQALEKLRGKGEMLNTLENLSADSTGLEVGEKNKTPPTSWSLGSR